MTHKLLVGLTVVLMATACTGGAAPAQPASNTRPDVDYGPDAAATEHTTPLIITALAPDPIPVTGTDGKVHVDYELSVLNYSPRPATLTKVETLAGGPEGRVVSSLSGAGLVAITLPVADYPAPPEPTKTVAPGGTVILLMDDVFDSRDAVPSSVVDRIAASFGPVKPNQAEFATSAFPEQITESGPSVRVSARQPVVIWPPLAGDSWVAVNACCALSPHRGAELPVGGRINGTERYAVDFSRFDLTARPIVDLTKNTQADFRGDPTRNESYFSFDQPILAVADGTVVTVVDNLPEATPRKTTAGLALADFGGNRIVLDIGNGVFAFYGHLKTSGVEVHVGDHVKQGQVIGRTGNSGNTTASHLHFHLMDSPLPLTATNLPWEVDRFTLVGSVTPERVVPNPAPGPKTNELPLLDSAMNFQPR